MLFIEEKYLYHLRVHIFNSLCRIDHNEPTKHKLYIIPLLPNVIILFFIALVKVKLSNIKNETKMCVNLIYAESHLPDSKK